MLPALSPIGIRLAPVDVLLPEGRRGAAGTAAASSADKQIIEIAQDLRSLYFITNDIFLKLGAEAEV